MIPDSESVTLRRVWTVPNVLSVARLGLVAWSLDLLFADRARIAAAAVLAVAGTTDFLDGWVARRFHQVSVLGKILDPTVDRIVLVATVVAIVVYGAVPTWLASAVLAREVIVGGAGIVLAILGAVRIDVVFIGKVGTFGFLCSFPLFLLGDTGGPMALSVRVLAWVIAIPSLACSFASLFAYVPAAREALAVGRRAVHPEPATVGEHGDSAWTGR